MIASLRFCLEECSVPLVSIAFLTGISCAINNITDFRI